MNTKVSNAKSEMKKIVVIGGTGLIGGKVVRILREQGHDVLAASPSQGINSVTGEGLVDALKGADVVVDVSNSPSFEDKPVMEFFQKSTTNLLAEEVVAGVKHHVALSVVGTDRLQAAGYFRAKLVQENLIKDSGIPYTIVRATQFFEFVGGIAHASAVGDKVHLPHTLMQPILSDDVAAVVAEAAASAPRHGTFDLAGPDPITIDDVVRMFLKAQGDAREVVTDPQSTYFGTPIDDRSLTPGENPRLAPTHFADWLKRTAPAR
jgi:uncharacterized protein YbjT (DUF2867 family)